MNKKTVWILILGLLLIGALALKSCKGPLKMNVPEPQVEAPEQQFPFRASLSINQQADARIPRGWPILLEGTLGSSESMTIKRKLVGLEVRDSQETEQTWPVKEAASGEAMFELNEKTFAPMRWVLPAEDSKKIKPGVYQVYITLEENRKKIRRGPHQIEILETAPESPEKAASAKALLEIRVLDWTGQGPQALTALQAYFAQNPNDLDALLLQAQILIRAQRKEEALKALNQFLEALPEGAMPPESVVEERRRLMLESLQSSRQNA